MEENQEKTEKRKYVGDLIREYVETGFPFQYGVEAMTSIPQKIRDKSSLDEMLRMMDPILEECQKKYKKYIAEVQEKKMHYKPA